MFVLVAFSALCQSTVITTTNHGLVGPRLFSASDAAFEPEWRILTQGRSDDWLTSFKQYVVVLHNTLDVDIVGISLRWRITGKDGRVVTRLTQQIETHAVQDWSRKRANERRTLGVVKAHEARAFLADQYWDSSSTGKTPPAKVAQYISSLVADLAAASAVSVELASVVLSDGACVDPGSTHLCDVVQGEIDSRTTLAREMIGKYGSGNGNAVMALLADAMAQDVPGDTVSYEAEYARCRKRLAQQMATVISRLGMQSAMGLAFEWESQGRPLIRTLH